MADFFEKQLTPAFACSTCDWVDYQRVYSAIVMREKDADTLLGNFVENHLAPEPLERLARLAITAGVKDMKKALDEDEAMPVTVDSTRALNMDRQEFARLDMAEYSLSPSVFGVTLIARLLAAAEASELAPQAAQLREKLDARHDVTAALQEMRSFGIDLYYDFVFVDNRGHARPDVSPIP